MKRLCAKAALDLVPDHGIIGLGGGETISYLAEYIKEARKGVKVVTPSDHTAQVCKKLGLEIVDTVPAAFVCDCSKERVSRALSTISKKDLDSIINDGESIEVKCQFCNKAYNFDIDELKELRK